ncbi:cytochrome c-type biogenesis protein CcmH [Gemmatimonadota bacterium]
MKRLGNIGLAAFLLGAWVAPLGGQEAPRLDEPVQAHPAGDAAISQLKSPYCPGMMLEVCPSTPAKVLRDSLQTMAWNGATTDSIVGWMLANHGEEYRAVPLVRGSGLWAWAMPPLALVAGLVLLTGVLRRFRTREAVAPATPRVLSEEDQSVLSKAMEELRASEEVPF